MGAEAEDLTVELECADCGEVHDMTPTDDRDHGNWQRFRCPACGGGTWAELGID